MSIDFWMERLDFRPRVSPRRQARGHAFHGRDSLVAMGTGGNIEIWARTRHTRDSHIDRINRLQSLPLTGAYIVYMLPFLPRSCILYPIDCTRRQLDGIFFPPFPTTPPRLYFPVLTAPTTVKADRLRWMDRIWWRSSRSESSCKCSFFSISHSEFPA